MFRALSLMLEPQTLALDSLSPAIEPQRLTFDAQTAAGGVSRSLVERRPPRRSRYGNANI
ncbi:hypothetical protein LMG18091_00036 [Ralstonia wenshanensis]|uniref:Uncharacterized protein n=1 Tax=Ralstonia wenshanensis TaxID=2842456 RepID=A0AAD2AN35_9RALS|nr:hypothetical protein LMG18091_00036 [Ralstonia wenshanensis]